MLKIFVLGIRFQETVIPLVTIDALQDQEWKLLEIFVPIVGCLLLLGAVLES